MGVVGMIILFGWAIIQCRGMNLASLGSLSHNTDGRVDSALLCSASSCFELVLPFSLVTDSDLIQRMQTAFLSAPSARHNPVQTMYKKAVGGNNFPNLRL